MSSLIGKLISLGLMEHAVKELRLLKKRLDELVGPSQKKVPKATAGASILSISDILDFGTIKAASCQVLNLVLTTQVQVLRVLSKLRRPTDIEAALPFLRESNKSSPTNVLLLIAESKSEGPKAARQLETVSQLLLALAPSISTTEDETASEPRLCASPSTALELQTIALQTRLTWWKLAGHQADVDKDILLPLSKCLAAYVRRTPKSQIADYKACLVAFNYIQERILLQKLAPSKFSKSPLASIYRTLGKLARESGSFNDAIPWIEKSTATVDKSQDSAARCLSASALLLAHRLRLAWKYPSQDALLKEVLDGLQGSLRGDSAELDELLDSLVMARKSATYVLVGSVVDENGKKYQPSGEFSGLLNSFVVQMPRFCLRWLGKRPSSQDNTKEFLRYEQRRTVLSTSASQILDSALMLAKTSIDEKRIAWEQLDSLLHDCLSMLDNLGELASVDASNSYHAKISHLYYMQHSILISTNPKPAKGENGFSIALRSLRRSIECVKHRPRREREKAQVLYKLERAGELYREAGRFEDALSSLQTLRSILIEDGALATVVTAMKTMPARKAWILNENVQSLSWTLRSIAKMEKVWVDWTLHHDEPERIAALEHRLEFILSKMGSAVDNLDPSIEALLQLCTIERFPVRRLRILLRLLISNVGNENRVQTIQAQIDEVMSLSEEADLGEDAGLKGCLLHIKALSISIIALARPTPDYDQIERSISTWQSILDSLQGVGELEQQVDDVPGLLEHLQSIADSARLSNHNNILSKALQVAIGLVQKSEEVDMALSLQISAALALQLTNIGQSSKASTIFAQAQESLQKGTPPPRDEIVRFMLSHAEYFVEIGNIEKADEVLRLAKETASSVKLSSRSRAHRIMMAQASLIYSAVALGRGDGPCALTHARNATRVLFQEWLRVEQQAKQESSADDSGVKLDTSLTEATEKNRDVPLNISGPEAWKLAHPVMNGLLFLSNIYAHLGMYQETVYYAEQSQKIAQAVDSNAYLAECNAWMSFISARAGKHEDALKNLRDLTSKFDDNGGSSKLIGLYCRLSSIYREIRDFETEKDMLQMAEAMVNFMAASPHDQTQETGEPQPDSVETKSTRLAIREKPAPTTRRTRVPVPKALASKAASKVAPKKVVPTIPAVIESEDAHLLALKASVMVEKASSMIHQKDWTGAWQILQEVRQSSKVTSNLLSELIACAKSLLGQSMDQMAKDAVYSVIQESTLSFPSISSSSHSGDRFSLMKASPPRTLAAAPPPHDVFKAPPQGYLENLREAREYLLEAHAMASVLGDGREVHRTLCMLQTVVILLSAASSSSRKAGILGHPGYATCSVEMARNLTWRREYKALLSEKVSGRAGMEWPEEIGSSESRRSSLSPMVDITKFQREYIDIIPQEWSVISISLSDNKHDLCISKLQAGQSPFVIRLPLERATSRDADNEVFNYQEGRIELLEIIKRANATCHDKRDWSVKGAKTAWWNERNALDVQLRELLEKIEQVWLGGFKGIFSQHQRHSKLLAKFQSNFETILDKHLPSRRQVRSKKTTKPPVPKVALDMRILELFIGLGDSSADDCDFDETLNDLLYFVVDILQFHGERNAYDEIDFDSMVVDTVDALHSYHAETKNLKTTKMRSHTILVLDKALHTFPWESLPCLQGLAVSRVPSLACLRRLILEQQSASQEGPGINEQAGHHVSLDSGTYMLNPSGDLKATRAMFEGPLASSLSPSWKRVENKAPTEAEFEKALTSSDILLYMGHGGGAQYIRNRTIRRLDKCRATALLMGCSSASLADVGDFEVYGLIWSYMLAGCPAVVGTLWDVTDKDIDLYTGRLYEEWGLVERGTFQPDTTEGGNGKAVDDGSIVGSTKGQKAARSTSRKRAGEVGAGDRATTCEYGEASLPEAVARARNSGVCKFKYLNAGAVCVYGIPVYVDRSGRKD